jgi:hypothetical protein
MLRSYSVGLLARSRSSSRDPESGSCEQARMKPGGDTLQIVITGCSFFVTPDGHKVWAEGARALPAARPNENHALQCRIKLIPGSPGVVPAARATP